MPPQLADLSHLADDVSTCTVAWTDTDTRVRDLHAELANRPGGDSDLWQSLVASVAARDEAARSLGTAIGRWVATGGSIELVDPAIAVPAPADNRASEEVAPADTGDVEPDASESVSTSEAELDGPVEIAAPSPVTEAPAPPPVAPAVFRGPPATSEQLKTLERDGLGGGRRLTERARVAHAQLHLDALKTLLAAPFTPADLDRVASWIAHVDLVDPLADDLLVEAVAALTARMRALQTHHKSAALDRLFPPLRTWVERRRPGFVHGLAKAHHPKHGSWSHDAESALAALRPSSKRVAPARTSPDSVLSALGNDLDRLGAAELRERVIEALDAGVSGDDPRLVKLVADRYDQLKSDGRLARLRKAVKEARKEAARTVAPAKDALPVDWPYWHLTRGKVAVVVGGDPRPANRDRIRDAFGFARVEWPEHDAKLLQRLAERATSGSVDVFLFNRYGGHVVDDIVLAEVRNDLARWVRIDRGYGVSAVRQAMEQHWAGLVPSER